MSLSFSNFNNILNKNFFCEKNPKLTVGVSGGPDSIALCILLNQWVKKKKGYLVALIVDHRVRTESLYESKQTENFLKNKGINCKVLFVSKTRVKDGKLSQSRINRFEKLLNYCKKHKIFYLFLGHHYDDNLETFILRKLAGSNFEGLNSMQFLKIFNNIQFIRPLLSYSKKDILLFNKKLNLSFINDPSNQNIKYSRSAVREYLISDNKIKKEINKEFKFVKSNYLCYKKMIFQLLNLLILKVELKKLTLNSKDFFKLNLEIKSNLLIKAIQYVHNKSIQIRSKKINNLIIKISKFKKISLKTNKTSIYRNFDTITITKC